MAEGRAEGIGPDAVSGSTYAEIQEADTRRELAQARLGRFGGEVKLPLVNGEVPQLPAASPWAQADGLGIDAAVDINGSDPSGTNRHKGVI